MKATPNKQPVIEKTISTNYIDTLKLNDTIKVYFEYYDGIWCVRAPVFNENGCGQTYGEALKVLRDNVLKAYEQYVKNFVKNDFTARTIDLNHTLISLVGEDNYKQAKEEKTENKWKDTDICPNCGAKMVHARVPFEYHGNLVGWFDGYSCPVCHKTYISERGYEEIDKLPLTELYPEKEDTK